MKIEDEVADHLARLRDHADKTALARQMLREVGGLELFPAEMLEHLVTLVPTLYNPGLRRFEYQRTPNLFVVVDELTCVAATDISISKATFVEPSTGLPRDGTTWKVLGGYISSSAASMVDLKDGVQGRIFFHGNIPITVATPIVLPGNGIELKDNRNAVVVNHEIGGVVDLMLFVCEESDTLGRGAV